jgi:hypothetical protein
MSRNVRFWLVLVAALVLTTVLVGGGGNETGPPYDPRSVAPTGAKGLVETLERLDIEVTLNQAVPDASHTAALVLRDQQDVNDERLLETWVRNGGVLVVADLVHPLARQSVAFSDTLFEGDLTQQECTIGLLAWTERLTIEGRLLDASGADSCFGDGFRALVVAEPLGNGTVYSVGSRDLFTNAELDEADAAVLAVSLLAPRKTGAKVAFLGPSVVDFGDQGVSDLVPPRVRNAIMQLLAAFLIYALYRSRRLGGVVAEPVPVRIEGSELVLRAGVLSERAKDPTSTAEVLRVDFVARASRALALGKDPARTMLIERVCAESGADPDQLRFALESPVLTDAELVATARSLQAIDQLLYDDAATTPAADPIPAPSTKDEQHV